MQARIQNASYLPAPTRLSYTNASWNASLFTRTDAKLNLIPMQPDIFNHQFNFQCEPMYINWFEACFDTDSSLYLCRLIVSLLYYLFKTFRRAFKFVYWQHPYLRNPAAPAFAQSAALVSWSSRVPVIFWRWKDLGVSRTFIVIFNCQHNFLLSLYSF